MEAQTIRFGRPVVSDVPIVNVKPLFDSRHHTALLDSDDTSFGHHPPFDTKVGSTPYPGSPVRSPERGNGRSAGYPMAWCPVRRHQPACGRRDTCRSLSVEPGQCRIDETSDRIASRSQRSSLSPPSWRPDKWDNLPDCKFLGAPPAHAEGFRHGHGGVLYRVLRTVPWKCEGRRG
eukprot:scaffold6420_cov168-Amphora_coffeaeformis.AAC.17